MDVCVSTSALCCVWCVDEHLPAAPLTALGRLSWKSLSADLRTPRSGPDPLLEASPHPEQILPSKLLRHLYSYNEYITQRNIPLELATIAQLKKP